MIEVFDPAAARIALARRKLGCPGCGQPMRLWGHARERAVRDVGGTLTIRPDRARCTGCSGTHVVLDAGFCRAARAPRTWPVRSWSPRRSGAVTGALPPTWRFLPVLCAAGSGGARRSADQLRITGIRTVLASGHDELLAWTRKDELGSALEHLTAAALVTGRRPGLEHTSWWALINVLTGGRLLSMAPAG